MVMTIVIVLVVLVLGILAIAAMKPDTFRVQRSARIKSNSAKIFPHINDFHNWAAWSPWDKMDPDMKRTYSGAPSGRGAVYDWKGNKKVGEGRMEITGSTTPKELTIKLDFLKPFEAHNTTEFILAPDGDGTDVTWAMHGRSPFMMKVMGLFKSMDSMIGNDFERGLASLKVIAEK